MSLRFHGQLPFANGYLDNNAGRLQRVLEAPVPTSFIPESRAVSPSLTSTLYEPTCYSEDGDASNLSPAFLDSLGLPSVHRVTARVGKLIAMIVSLVLAYLPLHSDHSPL
jgi:hypothetical protein